MIVHWMTTRQTAPTPDYQQNEQRQEQRYARLLQQVDHTVCQTTAASDCRACGVETGLCCAPGRIASDGKYAAKSDFSTAVVRKAHVFV